MYVAQTGQFFDTSVIAFTALIVAPIVSIVIARMQIRAQLVSANRQKWIEELRSHIAQYVSEVSYVSTSFLVGKYELENTVKAQHLHRIVLLYLNPELDSHLKLWSAITDHSSYLSEIMAEGSKPMNNDRTIAVCAKMGESADDILRLAHDCLKIESEHIKRGE